MGGELGINIISVSSDRSFVRPNRNPFYNNGQVSNDLTMRFEDDGFFHICGENDWAFLALQLLDPIKVEAKKIQKIVRDRKSESPKVKAVMLGKNDKRIMDVYYGGEGKCERILGLPVIATNELNEVKFLIEDEYLPFF